MSSICRDIYTTSLRNSPEQRCYQDGIRPQVIVKDLNPRIQKLTDLICSGDPYATTLTLQPRKGCLEEFTPSCAQG